MSSQPNRLAKGGMIDRSKTVRFSFDGEQFTGFQGDTLASALLANGMRLVGRSFKYHRPRGISDCGVRGAERAGRTAVGCAARTEHPGDDHRAL